MKVSVIIPVYNAEKYLRACLDSILAQSCDSFEVICVDDGSTDTSPMILSEYSEKDSRIKVIVQENMNAGVARNEGIANAKGEYLTFFDADDFAEDEYLETMYNVCVDRKADIGFCMGYKDNVQTGESELFSTVYKKLLPRKEVFSSSDLGSDILLFDSQVPFCKMFLRSFVENNELEFQKTRYSNDVYFSLMAVSLAKRMTLVDKRLYHYRLGLSTNLQSEKFNVDAEMCELLAVDELKMGLIGKGALGRKAFQSKLDQPFLFDKFTMYGGIFCKRKQNATVL